ncbi:MAG: spore coat biosynthesis protein F [Candidatus Raymondbacteria bacterium RifOxyA12_full_50_37]|nr:MAG: spore coat biosynthesis protein F [Candidatus Raymondbacteria bacterium RifOxyA12_full_50_37]OGJ88549.1 MAG: spore coat biosynthesis protein F [Candidatus Raymondbacteria bacterium RIFOXYA2_FULL_49_16]OGJ90649.1 MAG: spore coat biosynthesis protein F [Candidatus Raymondbacteria bacterium RifOxyB12_full_50_8]OGJ99008.1 MAG: spore coat biosynthesis protein F [Candidatus Raymondbacteria bacterium RIFOXYC2_FULL_50_21]OGK00640.1 MAG: spore coat biosynthesis protein F [Candidatus Raymondbacte
MKIVCTIEARMQSTRLPGKVLLPILGKPMLERLVERIRQAKEIDEVVIATTVHPSCDPIAQLAEGIAVKCFRGSEEDVLDRVLRAAQSVNADLIVELTGDNPLVDPRVISKVVQAFMAGDTDYCTNHLKRTYPIGMDVQVFPVKVLEQVASLTRDPRDHEHVSVFIYEHPEIFKIRDVESGITEDVHSMRLTVDTDADFRLICAVFERLYPKNPGFGLDDILALRKAEPGLFAVNTHIQQKKT